MLLLSQYTSETAVVSLLAVLFWIPQLVPDPLFNKSLLFLQVSVAEHNYILDILTSSFLTNTGKLSWSAEGICLSLCGSIKDKIAECFELDAMDAKKPLTTGFK